MPSAIVATNPDRIATIRRAGASLGLLRAMASPAGIDGSVASADLVPFGRDAHPAVEHDEHFVVVQRVGAVGDQPRLDVQLPDAGLG